MGEEFAPQPVCEKESTYRSTFNEKMIYEVKSKDQNKFAKFVSKHF